MSRYIIELPNKVKIDVDKHKGEMVMGVLVGEVVRCKECKHNYRTELNHGKMKPRCDFTDWMLTENDYCSHGEREGE